MTSKPYTPSTESTGKDTDADGLESKSPHGPAISLPKGGGAIRGIGEKFSVNSLTGTGSLSVPVFTSAGRSDFYPKLTLTYDSGSGNGVFGYGWRISVPSIKRKTDKGLPRYFDEEAPDIFLLSEAEDLVPVLTFQANQWGPPPTPDGTWNGEAYLVKRYRPRTEGLFARIERWERKKDGDTYWRATTKDNVTSIYGRNPACRVADPSDLTRVFEWLLEATFDDRGNVMFYVYKPEDTTGVNRSAANERNRQNGIAPFTNRYLKRIFYGNRTPYNQQEDLSRRSDWLFEVVFDYGEHHLTRPTPVEDPTREWVTRADPFSSFRSTFDIRSYRLCQRILMFHHFPPGPGSTAGYDGLVRSTDFTYESTGAPGSPVGNLIATKLLFITQRGYRLESDSQAYVTKSFPPIEFTYSAAQIDATVHTVEASSLENLPVGGDGSDYQLLDLDGEGLTGILTAQAGGLFYKRNLSPLNTVLENGVSQSRARFGAIELVGTRPSAVAPGTKPQFMDLAGDGRQDLVDLEGPVRGYYERTQDAGWEGLSPFRSFPNLESRDPNLKTIDIDGDGLADLLVSEDEVFAWYRGLGHDGFGDRQYARKPFDEERGAALVFNDPTQSIFLADMTGDGLVDIVRIRNGEICYWPNRGYGHFGAKVAMDNAPCFDTSDLFDPRRIRLADIDGCGTADILYLAAWGVAIYHNQSGNSWSEEVLLAEVPPINNIASVNTLDLLGNGTACLVWSSPLPADAGRQMRYLDLMGSQKPHLLVGIKNHLGAETRVRYASSTRFYVEDRAAGTPWVTKLAFPVYVVERAEVFDYIGRRRLVTTYRYRHGYFDGVEREFRGFGYVEQRDAESFGDSDSLFTEDTDTEADALHVAPVVTRTWFHTGAWPDQETITHHLAHEYFTTASEAALLPDTILPIDILLTDGTRVLRDLTGEEQREAVRALKGSILRQEIYADDGTAKSGVPYSVSERNYTIECFQPQGNNRYAVFFSHARETIDYRHERNPSDPRVAHNVVLKADAFGNVLQSVSVAYGRNLSSPGVQPAPITPPGAAPDPAIDGSEFAQPEQTTALLTLAENSFTVAIDTSEAHRTPKPSEKTTCELTRPARADDSVVYAFHELQDLVSTAVAIPYEAVPNPTKVQKRLFEDVRTLYLENDLSGPLPLGQMGSLALVFETYKLAFTDGLAQQVFITRNSNPNKPVDASALNGILSGDGGYVNSQGDANWWIPSGQTLYSPVPQIVPSPFQQDPVYAAAHFYLPQARRDPFGQYLRLTYDTYDLLLQRTQDALGNTVAAQNDYRVLQPAETIDPNGNHTQAAFDPLALVVGTAVKGKVTASTSESGDSFATFTNDLTQAQIDGFIADPNPVSLAAGLLGTATTRIIYDLERFGNTQAANPTDATKWKPIFTAVLARATHVNDLLPAGHSLQAQVSFSYADGLGREIQKKLQAEPGPLDLADSAAPSIDPRWVGSGWVILNNKDKPVRQYEPFFSATHDFEFANKVGVNSTLFYDPLDRVVATLRPNHAWEKVVFDPWRQRTWDPNDTVNLDPKNDPDVGYLFSRLPDSDYLPTWFGLRTGPGAAAAFPDPAVLAEEQDAAAKAGAHHDTPTAALFDVLGRQFFSVAHNRYPKNGGTVDEFYGTRTELDIQGNQALVLDALGRSVMRYDYDLQKNRIHQASLEAGERWNLNNVLGKPIRVWDSRGFMRTISNDELQRPVALRVTGNGLTNILAEKTVFGDSKVGAPVNPGQTNHRTRIFQVFDAAGIEMNLGANPTTGQTEGFDFKGNLLRSSRQLLQGATYRSAADWNQNQIPDEIFATSSRFDALNRVIQQVAPHSNQPGTKLNITQPTYNEANLLERIDVWVQQTAEPNGLLDPSTASLHPVTNLDYNAKGQRVLIEYGILDASQSSQVNTGYQYDPETFRLVNLTTTRRTDGVLLQALAYYYDPVGNITHIQDDADIHNVVYFRNKRVEPGADYTYDAIYRLLKATGREHLGQTGGVANAPTPQSYNDWPNLNLPHPNDGNAMGTYIENFDYDPVGNFRQLQHVGSDPANPGWTRTYAYNEASQLEPGRQSNRLSSTTVGGTTETYSTSANGYDPHGNMLKMPQVQAIQWDFKDQLQMTQRQAVNSDDADGTEHQGERTYYVYQTDGKRVRKVTESASGLLIKQRIYIGSFEIYREYGSAATTQLGRETLHVMEDNRRCVLVETRTQGDDGSPAQLVRFQFGNHLGSASLELDPGGAVISYEEYYPYGGTSSQAVDSALKPAAKRYRFTGLERDQESGLYYFGARYYASWLGRWASADPAGLADGPDLYRYARDNPVELVDTNGADPTEPEEPEADSNDPPPDPTQASQQNSGISSSALIQPEGVKTSEFTLQGFGSGGSPGASGGGSLLYHYRQVVAPGVEPGLQAGFGGAGPPATGTGVLNATLHLGQELNTTNLAARTQHLTGWSFTLGFLWGQNPTRAGIGVSSVPEETGGPNPAASALFAYSLVRSQVQGRTEPHLHPTFEFDLDLALAAQRFGPINGVSTNWLTQPSLILNAAFNDRPGDNWQTNVELGITANLGLGGVWRDPTAGASGSASGTPGVPFSLTATLGVGFTRAWGDYAFSLEPYVQHEAWPNVAAAGGTGSFTDGAWTGGIKIGFTGINLPGRDRDFH